MQCSLTFHTTRGLCPLLIYLHFLLIHCLIQSFEAVRVVALNVPSQVRKGSEVELSCLYELGNASLYSLKWFYRANETDLDEQEFFRYTPTIKPHKQFFPLDGVNVNVNKSEGGRVLIIETNGKTSGKYKCEISIDGTFQTVAAEKLMTVLGNSASRCCAPSLVCLTMLVVYLVHYLLHTLDALLYCSAHDKAIRRKLQCHQRQAVVLVSNQSIASAAVPLRPHRLGRLRPPGHFISSSLGQ